jgi:alpha-1,3-mannosyltransferase
MECFLMCRQVSYIPLTSWANVSAMPPVDFAFAPRKFHMMCCNKGQTDDSVHWKTCLPGPVFERDFSEL